MKPSAAFPAALLTLVLNVLPRLDAAGVTLQAELIRDINPGTNASSPANFVKAGQSTFFVAEDVTSGRELWKTDGTQAGTVRVKDIRQGTEGSFPGSLVAAADRLYFVAEDAVNSGRELWISDGTVAGTQRVKRIDVGIDSSREVVLAILGELVFFLGWDGGERGGLWRSDGTEAGTVFLLRQDDNNWWDEPFESSPSRGVLYFRGPFGGDLWKSDGTPDGTKRVTEGFNPGPHHLVDVGGTVYFWGNDGPHWPNLWKSDGTEAGTVLLNETAGTFPYSENEGSYEGGWKYSVASIGNTLFFPAENEATGVELWKTDGTEAGTSLVKDILPGERSSLVLTRINARSIFGTSMIRVGQVLYFTAAIQSNDDWPLFRLELWRSDGTEQGTALVKAIAGSGTSLLFPVHLLPLQVQMANLGETLFFGYVDKTTGAYVLWKTDGTSERTVPVEIHPRPPRNFLSESVVIDGTVFFATSDDTHGTELWKVRLGPWFEKVRVADGQLSGEIFDAQGGQFQLQGSGDLQHWTDLSVVNHPGGAAPFSVPATAETALFLRVMEFDQVRRQP